MSVDLRTRVDEPVDPVEPAALFSERLPAAAADLGAGLDAAARWFDPAPLVVGCDGGSWVLSWVRDRAGGGRLAGREARAGDPPADVALTVQQLTDLVHDLATPMAWIGDGTLPAGGSIGRLLDWWVLVRGALDGVAPYAPGGDLAREVGGDGGGGGRTFRPDDPAGDMRASLERTGYLHVAGVFGEDEMAAVSADMDAAAPGYRPGDGRSWWDRTSAGEDRLVRMLRFDAESPTVAGLLADDRLQRLGRLTGDGHSLAAYGRVSVEALIKPPGMVRGISDVPWHKDCSFGRHSYECCSLTAGIAVTGADRASGQLRALAGSHRALLWPTFVRPGTDLPVVDLPTRTGDVTVHLSCTVHMAQSPARRERRVLYTTFGLPCPRSADPTPARN